MILLLAGLALIIAGGASAAWTRRSSQIVYQMLVVGGCIVAASGTMRVLVSGVPVTLTIPATLPGGAWVLGIDALSAVFLLTILGVGGACAVFGAHDLARERGPSGLSHVAFSGLLTAIALVIAARSVVAFLSAWEVMAITSYLLIVRHHEEPEVRRAGLIYLVCTHTATLALFALFAIWQVPATDWSFAALAAASPSLERGATRAILLLALVGFGFKAGFVPLHFWLPPAHAAAPSHVSALMSGVVIKTGIYGLLRVLLLLGGAPAWWGWLLLGIGVASGVLGVLWALAQHDIKRLLAYHSVENIGIILMGIGIGVLGVAHNAPAIALLGFAGGLLHTVNHALFKSLLFLGAGAVYRATGTRNLEALGGLARRMPMTWLTFIVGAAAIVGLPPFNGFISEWLVYQGLFLTGQSGEPLRLALLGIPALALIGALALACFAKVAGVVFLGQPRTAAGQDASESPGATRPLWFLAAACTALGVMPALGIALTHAAASDLTGLEQIAVPANVVAGATAITVLAVIVIAVSALGWWLRSLSAHQIRREVTWGCGFDAPTQRMQYTASSFAAPLLSVFGRFSGTRTERSADTLHTHPIDLVLDGIAFPAWHALHRAALRLRPIQHGRLHLYLLYVLAALLVLLGYLSLGPR